jgi:biopolymer transport protein ExbB
MLNFETLHSATFSMLYACLVLLTFVVAERLLYLIYLAFRIRGTKRTLQAPGFDPAAGIAISGRDLINRSLADYVALQTGGASASRLDNMSTALFVRVNAALNARLWILSTIVTAAPLLGLLGTILGIMQTFNALAQGGVSDPAAVSQGIGTALIATAIGIGTALYGLVGLNLLQRQADSLTDHFKTFLLMATA